MNDKTHPRRTPRTPEGGGHQPEPFRSLLGALAGRSSRDFLVRRAVLQALAESSGPVFSARDLAEALSWLSPHARAGALRSLRHGGWLEHEPATGFVLTDAGRRAYEALTLLHRGEGESPSTRPDFPAAELATLDLRLASGLTADEIATALQGKTLRELAAAGREALLPALPPLPILTTDEIVKVAETHILYSHSVPAQALIGVDTDPEVDP